MNSFRRNVPLLAISQALMVSSMSLILTVSALVGYDLAENKSLATLPIAVIFIAVMCTSLPAALLMQRIGRKAGFMFATTFGIAGGVVATVAIINHNFWLFVCSGVLVGMFNGFGNYFRFTAADAVGVENKSRAISFVMMGGIAAAIIGPNLANLTRNGVVDTPFAASYMSIIILYILILIFVSFLKLPGNNNVGRNDCDDPHKGDKRSLLLIVKQPKFIVALICATLGYAVMAFVMTATPLAMRHHAYPFSDTSFVIQWHVLGMYAPSLITGRLILRYGVINIMLLGAVLGLACVCVNISGQSVWHYWLALTLLGIAWNFLFIGGTTLLTETYRLNERDKTQAINDFVIFTMVTIASLTAGNFQYNFGWQLVNMSVIPLLIITLISILWLKFTLNKDTKIAKNQIQRVLQDQEV